MRGGQSKMGYVQELQSIVGSRPLIIPGAALLIVDQEQLLPQHQLIATS